MDKELNEKYDKLIEMGVSEETLDIITSINGWNNETFDNVLFAKFGYTTFEQLEEDDDDYE